MARDPSKPRGTASRVLIPSDLPERVKVERALAASGVDFCAYRDADEAVRSLTEEPAAAVLLSGPANEQTQMQLLKKVQHVCPDAMIFGTGRRQASAEETGDEAVIEAGDSPEEIAAAVRIGQALKKAQTDDGGLREQLRRLEEQSREQTEQIKQLEIACEELREAAGNAESLALHDELTGLYNRRYFNQAAEQELQRARRENGCFAIALLDIDYFKLCNDQHGHVVGDAVLKEFAAAVMENVRRMDTVARYGGEESVVLLPETRQAGPAPFEPARSMERLRRNIAHREFEPGNGTPPVRLTLSAGVAEFPRDGETVDSLIEKADSRLYRAKSCGRNCICASDAGPETSSSETSDP